MHILSYILLKPLLGIYFQPKNSSIVLYFSRESSESFPCYLSDQFPNINNYQSESYIVKYGVPQGDCSGADIVSGAHECSLGFSH